MKFITSLFLASFVLAHSVLPGRGIWELEKLPALFHHYQKHRALVTGISFSSFLEMHYADNSHHAQDHQDHHKLPFTDHQSTFNLAFVCYFAEKGITLAGRMLTLRETNQSIYQSIVGKEIALMVWQPPRMN